MTTICRAFYLPTTHPSFSLNVLKRTTAKRKRCVGLPPQVYRHTQAGFPFLRQNDRPQPTTTRDTAPTPRQVSALPPTLSLVLQRTKLGTGDGANQQLGLLPLLRSPRPRLPRAARSLEHGQYGWSSARRWVGGRGGHGSPPAGRPRGVLSSHHDNYEGCRLLGGQLLLWSIYIGAARGTRALVSASAGRCIILRPGVYATSFAAAPRFLAPRSFRSSSAPLRGILVSVIRVIRSDTVSRCMETGVIHFIMYTLAF